MDRINRLAIDSTGAISDLCVLGTEFPTDKSPYHHVGHRHPYTAIYDFLFASRRYEALTLAEVGIADNMSMQIWRAYFPRAVLYGFDAFEHRIESARQAALTNTYYGMTDVASRMSVFGALNSTGQAFDILIDDSTHLFDHQINVAYVAVEFLKPGGMLIIEDIFRGWEETRYCDALRPLYPYFSSGTFIDANHANAFTAGLPEPYYDNDKLLVLFRNQTPVVKRHPAAADHRVLLDQALALPFFAARGSQTGTR